MLVSKVLKLLRVFKPSQVPVEIKNKKEVY